MSYRSNVANDERKRTFLQFLSAKMSTLVAPSICAKNDAVLEHAAHDGRTSALRSWDAHTFACQMRIPCRAWVWTLMQRFIATYLI